MEQPLFTEKICGIRLLDKGIVDNADPLTSDDIEALGVNALLEKKLLIKDAPVYLCGAASSSMTIAHFLARENLLPEWGSVLAASQKNGRGQLGREWISPRGNLYAALRLPSVPPFTQNDAAVAVGRMLAHALTEYGAQLRIKWPNDLIAFDSKRQEWIKFCGILLEERQKIVIAGIGINLVSAPPEESLRSEHDFAAGLLQTAFPEEKSFAVLPLWIRLAYEMHKAYCTWKQPEN